MNGCLYINYYVYGIYEIWFFDLNTDLIMIWILWGHNNAGPCLLKSLVKMCVLHELTLAYM